MNLIMAGVAEAVRTIQYDRAFVATRLLATGFVVGVFACALSLADGVLNRPVPYPGAERLVVVHEVLPKLAGVQPAVGVNAAHFTEWVRDVDAFDGIAKFASTSMRLIGQTEPRLIPVLRADGNLFDVLRVRVAAGRTLSIEDQRDEGERVALVSSAFWKRRLNSAPTVIGHVIQLEESRYRIVGVLGKDFYFVRGDDLNGLLQTPAEPEVYIPLRVNIRSQPNVGNFNYSVVARLRRGTSPESATAALDAVQAQIGSRGLEPTELRSYLVPLTKAVVPRAADGLWLLVFASAAVSISAAISFGLVSLSRAAARVRETETRIVLGADRARMIAQCAADHVLLAVGAIPIGLVVAWIGISLFSSRTMPDLGRFIDVHCDLRTSIVVVASTVVVVVLMALAPGYYLLFDAFAVTRPGRQLMIGPRHRAMVCSVMLVSQMSACLAIVTSTALAAAGVVRLSRLDPGFDTHSIIALEIALPLARYPSQTLRAEAHATILHGLAADADIMSAAWTSALPLAGMTQGRIVSVAGDTRPLFERPLVDAKFVSGGFFETLKMSVSRGRPFSSQDRSETLEYIPTVVSELTAATVWQGRDPIGQRYNCGQTIPAPCEVVGVVPDHRTAILGRPSPLVVYVPDWAGGLTEGSLLLRSLAEPTRVIATVRRVIADFDPSIAIGRAGRLEELLGGSTTGRRYLLALGTLLAITALVLAAVGVKASTTYAFSRRSHDIAIRVALGAGQQRLVISLVGPMIISVVVGAACGTTAALATARTIGAIFAPVLQTDGAVSFSLASACSSVIIAVALLTASRAVASLTPAAALRCGQASRVGVRN